HLLVRWTQPDQVQGYPADQSPRIRWRGWFEPLLFQFRQNKGVDLVQRPTGGQHSWRGGFPHGLERPPFSTLFEIEGLNSRRRRNFLFEQLRAAGLSGDGQANGEEKYRET